MSRFDAGSTFPGSTAGVARDDARPGTVVSAGRALESYRLHSPAVRSEP
ncbi:hypothetical protein [Halalkalicoccus salilacus]